MCHEQYCDINIMVACKGCKKLVCEDHVLIDIACDEDHCKSTYANICSDCMLACAYCMATTCFKHFDKKQDKMLCIQCDKDQLAEEEEEKDDYIILKDNIIESSTTPIPILIPIPIPITHVQDSHSPLYPLPMLSSFSLSTLFPLPASFISSESF